MSRQSWTPGTDTRKRIYLGVAKLASGTDAATGLRYLEEAVADPQSPWGSFETYALMDAVLRLREKLPAALVETIRTQLRGPGWMRLVNVTSKKEGNVEVYLLMSGESIGGLAVVASDVKELAIVNIVGPVDLEKLAKLEGNLGIPELGIESNKKKNDDEK
jgi:hypothetical protein